MPRPFLNSQGDPWTSSGSGISWSDERKQREISGYAFHELREPAITYACLTGAPVVDIAQISGHSKEEPVSFIGKFFRAGDGIVRALQMAFA